MTLVTQLTAAFQRVGTEFKSVRTALATKQMILTAVASTTAPATPLAGNYYQITPTAPQTMTLPTSKTGDVLGVMQLNSTAAATNTITINGTINGNASGSIVLLMYNEAKIFIADGTGGWAVAGSNFGRAAMDARYQLNGARAPLITVIPYAATITPDASLGNTQRVTATGNMTINAPLNPTEGQTICFEVTASGAAVQVNLQINVSQSFAFGTDFTTIPSIAAGKTQRIYANYRSVTSRWEVLDAVGGF